MPVDIDAILKVLDKQKVPNQFKQREQAIRIAWRIVKDWIEAQMAILETQMVDMKQIFLPYIQTNNGNTIYQLYKEKSNLLLSGGK